MRHVFQSWTEVAQKLERAPQIALFLDFDGTLACIRPTPEEVRLRNSLRKSLARIARSSRFFVWIISGRRQCDIRERVRVRSVRYLGLHGWEGRGAMPISQCAQLAMEGVKTWAGGLFANSPEVWVEDKGFSLAIHHRGAEQNIPFVKEAIQKVVEALSSTSFASRKRRT